MTAAELIGTMDYAAYLERERGAATKHEYINGQVYATAGGCPEHSRLAMRLGAQLLGNLQGRPCEVFNSDLRIRIAQTGRSTYPDVAVICGELLPADDDPQAATNPVLLAEVLSDSTETADRGEKWRHYQRLDSLQAYVLVSQSEPRVEVFLRSGDVWQYSTTGPGDRVALGVQGLELDVDALYRSRLPSA